MKIISARKKVLFMACCALAITSAMVIGLAEKSFAASTDIVISELMYNPASGNQDDEFLELHNKGSSPVDISGWSFSNGITLIFGSGTVIPAGGYAVISPNSTQTQTTYSVMPIANYTGALSNGGEQITLVDGTSNIIADITYDDVSPWASSADGNGKSLEMIEPSTGGYSSTSWSASLTNGGTPASQNTLTGLSLAQISNVTELDAYQAVGSTPVVTANVSGAVQVNLVYKVMFGAEQTVQMFDDGSHSDGSAGDGVYGASIPAQTAGQLVRYKVTANNGVADTSEPGNDESIDYYGYVVDDSAVSDAPIFRWYIDDADFNNMITNHTNDGQEFPTVVLVGNKVYDNATVYIKGDSSTTYPKKKFKFHLPSGYFVNDPFFSYDVDEFAIQVYFLNFLDIQEKLSWLAVQDAGFAGPQSEYVRVMKNDGSSDSTFYGHYLLTETFDRTWREQHGYEQGAYYKDFSEKKTRLDEDTSDRDDMVNNIRNLSGDALKQYLLDNFDVPTMINYSATMAVTRSEDRGLYFNVAYYRDSEGDLRWRVLPYDLDNAMSPPLFNENGLDSLIDTSYVYYNGAGQANRDIDYAFFQFPEFREMFYRRASTLYDQLFKSGKVDGWIADLYQSSYQTANEDHQKWAQIRADMLSSMGVPFPWTLPADSPLQSAFPSDPFAYVGTLDERKSFYDYGFSRYEQMVDHQRSIGVFPNSQENEPKVIINELMYNPAGGDDYEYIELYNPGDLAIDISGWKINGVDGTLPPGSVLPPKGYGLMVKNDLAFRSKYGGGKLIFGQYSGSLSNSGEELSLLTPNDTVIARFTYGVESPWPNSTNLAVDQLSLSLINTAYDYTNPVCWAPSTVVNGTPGLVNDIQTQNQQINDECLLVGNNTPSPSSTTEVNSEAANLATTGSNALALAIFASLVIAYPVITVYTRYQKHKHFR